MTRTNARELAMHLVYQMDYHDELPEELLEREYKPDDYPSRSAESELYSEKPDAKQKEYIDYCVRGVYAYKSEIDGIIEKYAKGWKVSRISKVSLAVLRLAIFEILHVEDAPAGAVINEAVEIARRYEEEEKVSFINGILGAFVRGEQIEQ